MTDFQVGDRVRMTTAYMFDGDYYPEWHPGVGSLGTIHETDCGYPGAVLVMWHDIRNHVDGGTQQVTNFIEDRGPLYIDTVCLELEVQPVTEEELQEAIKSIHASGVARNV